MARGQKRAAVTTVACSLLEPVRAGESCVEVEVPCAKTRKTMDLDSLCETLRDSSLMHYPEHSRTLLVQGLPFAIGTTDQPRHEFQDDVLALVRKALQQSTDAVNGLRATSAASVADAEKELQTLQAANAEKLEVLNAAQAAVTARTSDLKTATSTVRSHESLQASAENDVQPAIEIQKGRASDLAELTEVREGAVAMLTEGLEAGDDASIARLLEFLENIRAEKTLIAAVPRALKKPSADRGAFDQLTVVGVNEAVAEKCKLIEKSVADIAPVVNEASAFALGMWALLDVSREREVAAGDALVSAKSSAEAAAGEAHETDLKVRDQMCVVNKCNVEKSIEQEKLNNLTDAVEALERLIAGKSDDESEENASPDSTLGQKMEGTSVIRVEIEKLGA